MTTRGNVYAFERAFVWRVGSNGIATGQLDPDNLTVNVTSHAMQIHGPISAQLPDANFDRAEFKGGTSYEGSAALGLAGLSQGSLTASQLDASLSALLQGGLVDTTTLANASIAAPNSLNPSPRQVGLMLVARIQSRLSTNPGRNKYLTVIYPLVQMRLKTPNLTQEGGVNPSAVSLTFDPQVVSKFHTGVAFGANQGWERNSEFHYWLTADNPYALSVFIQNASATTFTTEFLPASSVITGGNTTNWYTIDGVPTAPVSHSTTTGLLTLAGAGTSGKIALAFHQTQYVPAA